MSPRTGVAAAKGLVAQLSHAHNRAINRCWLRVAVAEVSSWHGGGQTQQDDASKPNDFPAPGATANAERARLLPNTLVGEPPAGQMLPPWGNTASTADMQKLWDAELQRLSDQQGDDDGDEMKHLGSMESTPDSDSGGVRSEVRRRRKRKEMWEYDYKGGRRSPNKAIEEGNGMHRMYKTMMRISAQNGTWKTALAVINHMKDAGMQPNVRVYTMAITSCARGRQWVDAIALLREMEEVGSMPNVVSYGAAIHACANANKWEQALELLREMPVKGITPDVASWTSTIVALAAGREWEKAIRIIREMPAEGVNPNVASYNAAMKACRNGGQWQLAVDLLREMLAAGATPNAVSYSVAIVACGNCHQWEQALDLLHEMSAKGLTADVYSYRRDAFFIVYKFDARGVLRC